MRGCVCVGQAPSPTAPSALCLPGRLASSSSQDVVLYTTSPCHCPPEFRRNLAKKIKGERSEGGMQPSGRWWGCKCMVVLS
uniref:Uncharacterized protein n=1 Tax=Leersia perrieri TaxID=77586 RepID=A0A0D9WB25_9ORYZ